ncbi:MAG TPA: TonB-dependent receptor [Casimicrobiaceae bacterium]|nr:TonB-dependent receptor [Casimicrobiaceae bacterium]
MSATIIAASLAALPTYAVAQERDFDPVVVTATRQAQRAFDLPVSIDTIDARAIVEGQPLINLSETLVRVPGIVAQNRQNYAQDLQISSRGFGARAAFGVRGIRLYQDEIPATMPDGQGQTGSFQLLSAQRIEVLRGPFSTLYGNASGGVISVMTESGTPEPIVTAIAGGGSYGTWTAGAKATGTAGRVGYVAAVNHFETDGFRDHSSARRTLGVGKLAIDASAQTSITLIGSVQEQPDSQDPLGLTRAQWSANPRQADAATELFDTRKTVRQSQGGARIDHAFSDATSLRITGYAGKRDVRQFLALTGVGATSSGGVVDLDREFGGASVKLFHRARVFDTPLTLTIGADFDEQRERRQGFVNNFGTAGDLRRDEDDVVRNRDVYAQVQWLLHPKLSLLAGVRSSNVRFRSDDHYVTAANPDDSGRLSFRDTTPVAGLTFHATEALNLYASYGEGFETPTFAELAYRRSGPGLNFDLRPATSRAVEVGVKAIVARRHRINAAWFAIDTDDEIVIDAATGGRTTFRNAGKTRRRGVELAWDGEFDYGLAAHAALTWLRAEFASDFATGVPPVTIASGAKLPGVPSRTAFGELRWNPPSLAWLSTAIEVAYVDRIYVNDRNSDFAPSYAVVNVRAGVEHSVGALRMRAFARVNNIADRNYVGSVIVGDTNGRFFEPAPGRNVFFGAALEARL